MIKTLCQNIANATSISVPGFILRIGTTRCKVRCERRAHPQCTNIPNVTHRNFLCLTMHAWMIECAPDIYYLHVV